MDASETFRQWLSAAIEPHGAIADLCRDTGLSRRAIEKWREGETSPTIENLEKLAEARGLKPWQLLKEGATSGLNVTPDLLPALLELATLLPRMKPGAINALLKVTRKLPTLNDTQIDAFVTVFEGLIEDDTVAHVSHKPKKTR